MNTEVTVYKSDQFGQVRTCVDESGKVWFSAKDVCDILGYVNPTSAVRNHVKSKGLTKMRTFTRGGEQYLLYVDEEAIYSLALASHKDNSKPFKEWISSQIIPSVRKTGSYMMPQFNASQLANNREFMEQFCRQYLAMVEQNKALEGQVQSLQVAHKEEVAAIRQEQVEEHQYLDTILSSGEALTISQIAMDYGTSGQKMNDYLHRLSIQYKQNGQWLLYGNYRDKGYVKTITLRRVHAHSGLPFTIQHTLWTQKGREFLYNTLKKRGILPIVERPTN